MEISKAESKHFEALVALDEGDYAKADAYAYQAMLMSARALVRTQYLNVSTEPEDIAQEFRTRFYDTELFFDPYAKGKFARYFLHRHEHPPVEVDQGKAYRMVEEAGLFIEATHTVEARVNGTIVS
jgi:sulfite reductase (ferredoxin)